MDMVHGRYPTSYIHPYTAKFAHMRTVTGRLERLQLVRHFVTFLSVVDRRLESRA